MLSFIAIIIPALTSVLLYIFWNRKVVLLEFLALFACSFIAVGIVKLISDNSNTTDIEYWNGVKQEVRWYQEWDEEVPCRHPVYCTRTYECNCDDKGQNCSTCTEEYVCGYEHAYDVDFHPEYWYLVTSINSYGISESEYNRLSGLYGNKTLVDQHRDYHSIDGDMYSSTWKGQLDILEMVTEQHTYENRVQASKSVFNFPEVDTADVKFYKLYEYPQIIDNHQQHALGIADKVVEHKLDILNGLLGNKKQLTASILLFRDKPIKAADLQEAYWKGGNKNEFIVCIGVDKTGKPTWCKPFSWSEVAEPKITIRNFVLDQEKLDIAAIVDFMHVELDKKFRRKDFKDFEYITIPITSGQLLAAVIITAILNILIAIWSVYNEFEDTSEFVKEKLTLRPLINNIKYLINQFAQWCNNTWNKIFKIKTK